MVNNLQSTVNTKNLFEVPHLKIVLALICNYFIDAICLIAAISATVISFRADNMDLSLINNVTWFERSGSLMVLSGILLEWHQRYKTETVNFLPNASGIPMFESKKKMSKPRNILHYTAITFAVFGTVIWGYGDLYFKLQ